MKRLMHAAVFLFMFVGSPCFAQSVLPDKPQPRTVDREFIVSSSALAVGWTLDTISTVQRFDWCNRRYGARTTGYEPHCLENGGFFNGTRDAAKVMGAWAAVDVATVIASYEWKKHVHNRWLHPLWRIPLLVGSAGHSRSAIKNWTY